MVAPWFLSPGLLLDRVRAEAAQLDMPVAAPLGADRLVADVVVQRYASAIAAPVPTPH
ncbi:cobalamin biosynthesis protein CbiX [Mycobacteroides abscessus subsp. abscessus]|nr:cobalamin biosynthesis protein CbiX [Mycobacteroides abscessus subsp. abscessus]